MQALVFPIPNLAKINQKYYSRFQKTFQSPNRGKRTLKTTFVQNTSPRSNQKKRADGSERRPYAVSPINLRQTHFVPSELIGGDSDTQLLPRIYEESAQVDRKFTRSTINTTAATKAPFGEKHFFETVIASSNVSEP
jgi:hypothetical protein